MMISFRLLHFVMVLGIAIHPDMIHAQNSPTYSDRIKLIFGDAGGPCSFQGGHYNFCNPLATETMTRTLKNSPINFNNHYIITSLPRKKDPEGSMTFVVIDKETGHAIPPPFDILIAGPDDRKIESVLTFSADGNELCTRRAVWSYKSIIDPPLCWKLNNDSFSGDWTPYFP